MCNLNCCVQCACENRPVIIIIYYMFFFSHEAFCAFCNCGSEMAQILGQINRYIPSSDFDPFEYEEQGSTSRSRESSADKYSERPSGGSEVGRPNDIPLKPEKRSVGRPPGKRKRRGRQPAARLQLLSIDMCTFGTPYRPEISDVFDADGCIWAHHCCAAWSAGVCQTDSFDLENVDKAAYKAMGEVRFLLNPSFSLLDDNALQFQPVL